MKKVALLIVLAAGLGLAFMPKGVVGKMFPYLQGENYLPIQKENTPC